MKKLLVLLLMPLFGYSQNAGNILNSRNYVYGKRPVFIPMLADSTVNIFKTSVDSLAVDYALVKNKPTIPAAQVNSDWNSVSGVSQILNKPTIKRIETYTGTTNGSGTYTVTYGTAFGSKPKVLVSYEGSNNKANVFVSSSSTTGFTITTTQYNAITALGFEVLAGAPTALTGATVNVIVIE